MLNLPVEACATVMITGVEVSTVWSGLSSTLYPNTLSVEPVRVMILVSVELLVETLYDESGNKDEFVIVS